MRIPKTPKKRQELIDIVVEIPTPSTLEAELYIGIKRNRECDSIATLINTLFVVTKGTKNEDIVKEIIQKSILLSGYEELAEEYDVSSS